MEAIDSISMSRAESAEIDSDAFSAVSAPASDLGPANPAISRESLTRAEAPGLGLQNDLVQHLVPSHLRKGVLIPLKTTLEVRQDHTLVQAYITRAPTKSASQVVECVMLPFVTAPY